MQKLCLPLLEPSLLLAMRFSPYGPDSLLLESHGVVESPSSSDHSTVLTGFHPYLVRDVSTSRLRNPNTNSSDSPI